MTELISGTLDPNSDLLNSRVHTVYHLESQEMCPVRGPHVFSLLLFSQMLLKYVKVEIWKERDNHVNWHNLHTY